MRFHWFWVLGVTLLLAVNISAAGGSVNASLSMPVPQSVSHPAMSVQPQSNFFPGNVTNYSINLCGSWPSNGSNQGTTGFCETNVSTVTAGAGAEVIVFVAQNEQPWGNGSVGVFTFAVTVGGITATRVTPVVTVPINETAYAVKMGGGAVYPVIATYGNTGGCSGGKYSPACYADVWVEAVVMNNVNSADPVNAYAYFEDILRPTHTFFMNLTTTLPGTFLLMSAQAFNPVNVGPIYHINATIGLPALPAGSTTFESSYLPLSSLRNSFYNITNYCNYCISGVSGGSSYYLTGPMTYETELTTCNSPYTNCPASSGNGDAWQVLEIAVNPALPNPVSNLHVTNSNGTRIDLGWTQSNTSNIANDTIYVTLMTTAPWQNCRNDSLLPSSYWYQYQVSTNGGVTTGELNGTNTAGYIQPLTFYCIAVNAWNSTTAESLNIWNASVILYETPQNGGGGGGGGGGALFPLDGVPWGLLVLLGGILIIYLVYRHHRGFTRR